MTKLTAIFDLDGTLTQSAPGIMNGIQYTIDKEGLRQLTPEEKRSCVGPPLGESFMRLFGVSRERAEYLLKVYREYYAVTGLLENELYEGILHLLGSCRDAGIDLWICTAKPHPYLLRILEHFDMGKYFSHVSGADFNGGAFKNKDQQLAELLRNAGGSTCIMIGDRDQDIHAAKANSILSIGALWGYGSLRELTEAGADYICETPLETEKRLLQLQK